MVFCKPQGVQVLRRQATKWSGNLKSSLDAISPRAALLRMPFCRHFSRFARTSWHSWNTQTIARPPNRLSELGSWRGTWVFWFPIAPNQHLRTSLVVSLFPVPRCARKSYPTKWWMSRIQPTNLNKIVVTGFGCEISRIVDRLNEIQMMIPTFAKDFKERTRQL